MTRRKSRILAVQALYSYDVGGAPLDELLKFEWDADGSDDGRSAEEPDGYDFARILLAGTINHVDDIDKVIQAHLSQKWELDRISRVSLAILRLSVFSLLYLDDMAPSIVIDEAISLAKEYGSDDSFKFINAILDNISKEHAV